MMRDNGSVGQGRKKTCRYVQTGNVLFCRSRLPWEIPRATAQVGEVPGARCGAACDEQPNSKRPGAQKAKCSLGQKGEGCREESISQERHRHEAAARVMGWGEKGCSASDWNR